MLCPLCKTEMRIPATRTMAEGDNRPDTATNVYIVLYLTCTNAQCANHGKIVEQRRAYLIGQA